MAASAAYELNLAEIIGYIGGGVLAVALAPQFVKSFKTRSTEDISYGWQAIYIVGLWLNFVYFIMVGAVAAWATLTVEIAVAHALLFLKLYLDGCRPGAQKDEPIVAVPRSADQVTLPNLLKSNATHDVENQCTPRSMLGRTPKLFGDSSCRTRPSIPLSKSDLLTDHYRGFHYTIDAVFFVTLPAEFGNTMMTAMLAAAAKHNVRAVSHQIEIFDGSESPPGFASAILIDESHMSAHCYSDQGMLAFDCFTCGANPDNTRMVTWEVYNFLKDNLGAEAAFEVSHMPRFPCRRAEV